VVVCLLLLYLYYTILICRTNTWVHGLYETKEELTNGRVIRDKRITIHVTRATWQYVYYANGGVTVEEMAQWDKRFLINSKTVVILRSAVCIYTRAINGFARPTDRPIGRPTMTMTTTTGGIMVRKAHVVLTTVPKHYANRV
jgi:hypothetical protein